MKTILLTLVCLFLSASCFSQEFNEYIEPPCRFYILDTKKVSKAKYTHPKASYLPNTGRYLEIKIAGNILDSIDYTRIEIYIIDSESNHSTNSFNWEKTPIKNSKKMKKYPYESEYPKMRKQGDHYILKVELSGRTGLHLCGFNLKRGKYSLQLAYEDPETEEYCMTNEMELILR